MNEFEPARPGYPASIELTDIGVNLAHDSFDTDRSEVIRRAALAGVTRMIVTGTTVTTSARAAELAASHSGLFATAGVHPHHADTLDEHALGALRELARAPRVVAIGECGLDFYRNFSPRAAQEAAFEAQLRLAVECRLPVFLHQRDAHERFIGMLSAYRRVLSGGVAHCFTGGPAELEDCLELGLHIGVTGWLCDERRGAALRDALPRIPLDRLLLETDAPYLLPRDLPGKPRNRRNEPAFLPHVLERIAVLVGQPMERIAAAARKNTERLFSLPEREG